MLVPIMIMIKSVQSFHEIKWEKGNLSQNWAGPIIFMIKDQSCQELNLKDRALLLISLLVAKFLLIGMPISSGGSKKTSLMLGL